MRQKGERVMLRTPYHALRQSGVAVSNGTLGTVMAPPEVGEHYLVQFDGFEVVHKVPQHWVTDPLKPARGNHFYYVDSYSGWHVVEARDMRDARSDGVREYGRGRGRVKEVRRATDDEVRAYLGHMGEIPKTELAK